MHYQTESALSNARINDLMPIRLVKIDDNGYYHLRAATGERKVLAGGAINTALANAAWPKVGKWAVAWMSGKSVR